MIFENKNKIIKHRSEDLWLFGKQNVFVKHEYSWQQGPNRLILV